MLLELLNGIALFFYWTWFVWPFVFIFSLVYSVVTILRKDDRTSIVLLFVASISCLIILCGIVSPLLE